MFDATTLNDEIQRTRALRALTQFANACNCQIAEITLEWTRLERRESAKEVWTDGRGNYSPYPTLTCGRRADKMPVLPSKHRPARANGTHKWLV